MVEVRKAAPGDWQVLRDIRLAALRDAPDAFGSTYAETVQHPDEEWQRRAAAGNMVLAYVDGTAEPAGLAGGFVEVPGTVELVSMWVSPQARGRDVGDALIEAVAAWARETHDAATLHLWVTESNKAARRLYERCGFRPTGERQPLPSNPALQEIAMSRPLLVAPLTLPRVAACLDVLFLRECSGSSLRARRPLGCAERRAIAWLSTTSWHEHGMFA